MLREQIGASLKNVPHGVAKTQTSLETACTNQQGAAFFTNTARPIPSTTAFMPSKRVLSHVPPASFCSVTQTET